MTVNVKNKNGLRYGTFDIHGIKGSFPNQAITNVNLEQAEDADESDFNFGTNILEIIEMEPQRLIDDVEYKQERIIEIKQIIEKNPDKLCMFNLS